MLQSSFEEGLYPSSTFSCSSSRRNSTDRGQRPSQAASGSAALSEASLRYMTQLSKTLDEAKRIHGNLSRFTELLADKGYGEMGRQQFIIDACVRVYTSL
jgi:hypothetical protein